MIKRKLFHALRKHLSGKEAIVVTGMRQVGKTTLLRQLYDEVAHDNKLFLDFENPLNRRYFESEDFEEIVKNLGELGVRTDVRAYLFFDEIQYVAQVPSAVKYLIDHYGRKFFLTGSASFYLKNLFSESLSGRKYLFELFPLDFEEFLWMKNIARAPSRAPGISRARHQTWQRHYAEYVAWGGFPAVVLKRTKEEKRRTLEDIFTSYFNKEVGQLGDFKNNRNVRDLILLLLARVGSKLDVQKLSVELGISRATVKDYLAFLEGTYMVSLVRPFSRNRDSEIRSTPKVYACDAGLVANFARVDFGRMFENAVFHQLRAKGEVNYYQKKTGAEIDFIVGKKRAYEVKTMASTSDRNRLAARARELRMPHRQLISYQYAALPQATYGFQL